MSATSWTLNGAEFVHCNCDYGCPCQFSARPTQGHCQALGMVRIEQGRHGDTALDGLSCGMLLRWPGAIHEGGGEAVPIVDERASPAQREALLRIMAGEDTEPGATFFQVFASTMATVHEPVFAPVELDIDVDARSARVRVPGLVESRGEPIVNPVTGEPQVARIQLPNGFEFDICEVGRGWTESQDPLPLTLSDTHAHFARLRMSGSGVHHEALAA